MDFLITSYESVGSIKFGMSIEEVRSILNSSVKTFMKTSSSELPSDAFYQLGLQIYYKHPEICNAIELASPANPIFQSQTLLGRPFSEVCRWFEQRDSSLEIFDTGLTSYSYGLGLYAPSAGSLPNDPVEGVIVFERGYYDY